MSTVNLAFSFIATSLLFTVLGQSGSCRNGVGGDKAPVVKGDRLAAGVWGGEHIRLEATDGGATVEYDCANSTIDRPVVLDGAGNFDVKGRYAREHAGPVLRDEADNSRPARYVGHVKDEVLTLTVTLTDTEETVGTFTLTHGSEGRVMKCR
ncbi:MAG: hypothetical protein DMF67_17510 [Acidobacteria bacterium]|nr:MAG: hypothetical protein DMF67_17510 [Acidobacteriota bacterium]